MLLVMNKNAAVTCLFIAIFSCKNEVKKPFETFSSQGHTESYYFTFCSTISTEVKYTLRVGQWTFKSSKGYKIAEGFYDNSIKVINNHGGCPYELKQNSIDFEKWKFWNENGQLVKPNQKMLKLIMPNPFETENPF